MPLVRTKNRDILQIEAYDDRAPSIDSLLFSCSTALINSAEDRQPYALDPAFPF
jgi:hypothetical protein